MAAGDRTVSVSGVWDRARIDPDAHRMTPEGPPVLPVPVQAAPPPQEEPQCICSCPMCQANPAQALRIPPSRPPEAPRIEVREENRRIVFEGISPIWYTRLAPSWYEEFEDTPTPIILSAGAASARALELLRSALTAEQREEFDRSRSEFDALGYFHVHRDGNRTYRITTGRMYNIHLYDSRNPSRMLGQMCAGPESIPGDGFLPVYDFMLGQKLHLESDEMGLIDRANFVWGGSPLTEHPWLLQARTTTYAGDF